MTGEREALARARESDRIIAGLLDQAANTVSGLDLGEIGDGHALANRLWRITAYLRNRRRDD